MKAESSTYSDRRALLAILLAALIIRILYLAYYSSLPVWDQLTVDNYYHHNWAQSISEGDILGGTTYFRAPLYVFCLAGLYAAVGTSLWVGRVFGILVGVLSVFLTYRIGRRVFDRRIGLVAAAIQAIFPMHLYFEGELLLDPLFTLLLQLAVDRVLVWWDLRKTREIFVAGLLFGLAAITRPTALVLLLPVALLLMAGLKMWRPIAVHIVVLVVGVALVVLPVTVRNIIVASEPVLISSQGGINFYIGNNEAADGVSAVMAEPLGSNWRIQQITHLAETAKGRPLTPGEVSTYWFQQAEDWITENPARFISLYARKLYHHISNREISNNRTLGVFFEKIPFLNFNPLSFGILFGLTAAGFWRWQRRNRKAGLLLAMLVTYVAVSSAFFFSSRFRLPLLPYFTILASATLFSICGDLFGNFRRALSTVALAIAFGLISYYPLVALPAGGTSQHLISEGLYYLGVDDYEHALESLTEARRIDPSFPETNLNLGVAFLRIGNIDSALFYFQQEKRYNPGRVKADINIASISLLRGEYDRATALVAPAIRATPYDVIANTVLLRGLFGDTLMVSAAIQDSVVAAARRTDNDISLLNEAAIRLTERGDLEAASSILGIAAVSHPPPIETDDNAFERHYQHSEAQWRRAKAKTYYQWGYVEGLSGEYDRAIQYSRESIELDSSRVEAYVNLISGYLSVGRHAEARQVLGVASTKFPNDPYLGRLNLNR